MIKYKKPISITRKFQYGGAVAINPSYADDILQGLSQLGETIGGTVSQALSKIGPKVTPITRAISKVAGPIGIASMILTPAQANVGEDEYLRRIRSAHSFADLAAAASDGQASGEQANESATTEEEAAAGTVSNPQENPNKKKEDNKDKKDEEKRTNFKTLTQKIKNGKNSVDQFWGNRANWWETSTNSSATPLVRGFHNWITRPAVTYEFIREGIPGITDAAQVLGGIDNTFDPRPLWGYPRLLPKIQTDSVSSQTDKPQQVYTTNIDTTAINNQISNSDSLQNIINKRNGY